MIIGYGCIFLLGGKYKSSRICMGGWNDQQEFSSISISKKTHHSVVSAPAAAAAVAEV